MKHETVYLLAKQVVLLASMARAVDGKKLVQCMATGFSEYASADAVDRLSSMCRSVNPKANTLRRAADYIPHHNLAIAMAFQKADDALIMRILSTNRDGIGAATSKTAAQFAVAFKNKIESTKEMETMTEINKANVMDFVVQLAKAIAAASDSEREAVGLKAGSSPAEFVGAAIKLALANTDTSLHATINAMESLGAMMIDTPAVTDMSQLVRHIMATPAAAEASGAATTPAITINPAFEQVLGVMLSNATGGAIADAKKVLDVFNEVSALREETHKLRTKLATASSAVAIAPVESEGEDGEKLSCAASMVDACDIFTGPGGKKSKALAFPVPQFKWSGKNREVPDVDDNYQFRVSHLLGILNALSNNKNVWLYGHTGTGKSSLIEQIAARLGWPVTRINLDSGIERSDLIGKTELVLKDGKQVTQYVEGLVIHAMRNGHILLLDEIDFGRSDVMYTLQRMLEGKGIQLLEGDKRELVKPHPNFRVIATANTKGQGDEMGMYQGALVQSEAFRDRFTVWIEVDYLDTDKEIEVIKAAAPAVDASLIEKMVKFATEIRKAFISGEILQTISPRSLTEMARSYAFYEGLLPNKKDALNLAIELTTLNKAGTETQATLRELANRVFI